MIDWTDDVISDVLTIRQHRRGYRFGIDALLLATDLPPWSGQRILELGAAHGPVSLSLAMRLEHVEVTALEVQPPLYSLLEHNSTQDFGTSQVSCLLADVCNIRQVCASHAFDLVVFNPPYFPIQKRRPSEHKERAIARHEVLASLDDFLSAAQYTLRPKGWCKFVIPPWRLPDVYAFAQRSDFGIVSCRSIHADQNQDAYLCEVVMRRGARVDLTLRPMLCIRDEAGYYTQEVCQRVASAANASPSPEFVEQVQRKSKANP